MRTKDENHRGFSKSGGGFEELFNKSHAAFAELAIQNSETKFVIKLKYKSSWYEKIDMAIKKYCQKKMEDIPNLILTSEVDAVDLIKKSILIYGINSTTMLESRIFGRPVIVPVFEEASGIHKDKVYYQEYFGRDFITASSPEEFIQLGQKILDEKPDFNIPNKGLLEEFLGYTDGLSSERVEKLFYKVCNN